MIRKQGLLPIFLALGLGFFSHWVMADDQAGGPCAGDAAQFCSDAKGPQAIRKCLKENESKLSVACREANAKMKAEFGELKAACGPDKEKFCKDVKPGKGGILKCLMGHEKELSANCKKEMGEMRERRKQGKS